MRVVVPTIIKAYVVAELKNEESALQLSSIIKPHTHKKNIASQTVKVAGNKIWLDYFSAVSSIFRQHESYASSKAKHMSLPFV
jgi:hypothetical protein